MGHDVFLNCRRQGCLSGSGVTDMKPEIGPRVVLGGRDLWPLPYMLLVLYSRTEATLICQQMKVLRLSTRLKECRERA